MGEIDVTQEWQRLQKLYAGMSEEELEAIAANGYELTDIAKQVLNAEISRRNLKVIVNLTSPMQSQPVGDPNFDPANLELTAWGNVERQEEAEWVKEALNNAGIPCYFGQDLLEDVDRLRFSKESSVGVSVLKNDLDRVRWVLRDFHREFPRRGYDEELPDLDLRCPKCHSADVVLQGYGSGELEHDEDTDGGPDTEAAVETEPAEDIVTDSKYHWSCDACGHQWADDGIGT